MGKIVQLEQEARRLGKMAENAGDLRGAMAAVHELVRIVELLAKIQDELKEPGGTTVNVVYVNAPGLGKATGGRCAGPAEPRELDSPTNSAESVIVDVISSRCTATLGAAACNPLGEAVQRGLLRAPLGQNGAGDGPIDPSGATGQAGGVVCAQLSPII